MSPGLAAGLSESEIIQRATAALRSDWSADLTYACIEKDEVQKEGRVSSKTFEVVMIDGSDYHVSLAVDDQPLPPDAQKAELVKLNNEVQRRAAESSSARRARIEAWRKKRDENGELLLEFPAILTFHLVGEETKNGRSAYVFDGAPKPGVVATTRATKVLSGMLGKVWVDQETLHPMRVECTVVRSVPVFGALASVLPGTRIEIGMTQVTDSVWLIDEVSIKLNVSKLHLFKSSAATRSTYTQYRLNSLVLEELLSKAGQASN